MLRYRFRAHHLVPAASLFLAIAAGCSADDTTDGAQSSSTTTTDSGAKTPISTGTDTDATTTPPIKTTETDSSTPPPTGCALYPNANFCDDFDNADALTAGKTKWDFIEPTDQPVATLVSDRAVSKPSSLLSRIIDGTTPGAKFAKTITKSGFTEVTWDYDVYLESIGGSDGFFLDDFQFTDATGTDSYGFRLVMFAKDNGLDYLRVEHNGDAAVRGEYDVEDKLPDGTVALGKWMHFTQNVKFTFATSDAGDASRNKATYTLSVDGTQAFSKEYVGLARSQATFARIAGLAYVFNKTNSAGLKINWDNEALALK
jgi:hypothetical protein